MLRGKCPKCGWDYYGWKRDSYIESPYTQEQWNSTIVTKINQVSAQIHMSSYCSATHVITHYDNMRLLEKLDYFKITPEGEYKLGRHNVLFTDKIEVKNKLFIFSDRLVDLKALPINNGYTKPMEEVIFKTLDYFTTDDIRQYKKKLLGCITIDNYDKYTDEKY